jgi:hypothetical protein
MIRRKRKGPAKHYLYVSDAKLDMLFDQIPKSLGSKISGKVGVDFKVVSVNLVTSKKAPAIRADKLSVVEKYISQSYEVTTTDRVQNGGYFRGQLAMHWGFIDNEHGAPPHSAPVVVFKSSDDSTTLVLSGSRRNVPSSVGDLREIGSGTALPDIARILTKHVEDVVIDVIDHDDDIFGKAEGLRLPGPQQTVEFLATCWTQGDVPVGKDRRRVVIGSPWYVAIAAENPAK